MSLSEDFLNHANELFAPPKAFPDEIALRRVVSALYYALFHKIVEDSTALIGANVSLDINHRIQRWFEHGAVKQICGRFLKPRLEQPSKGLIGESASLDLQVVCNTFISLQEARHEADSAPYYSINTREAIQHFEATVRAINAWKRIRDTSEANVFILSLLLFKRRDRER